MTSQAIGTAAKKPERGAPATPPPDRARTRRLRHDQVGHDRPDDQHDERVSREGEHAQVTAGQARRLGPAPGRTRRTARPARRPRPGSTSPPARSAAARCGTGASGSRPTTAAPRPADGLPARPGTGVRARGLAHPSPRIVRRRRGGIVSGVWAASSATASTNRSSSASEVKKPTLIRRASTSGDRPGDREDPGAELVEGGLRRPARDPERHERGHLLARRDQVHAVDRGQAVRRRSGHRRAPRVHPVEPDEHRSASRSSGPCRRSTAGGSSTTRTAARPASAPPPRSGRPSRS